MKKIYFLSLIALSLVFSANCAKAQKVIVTNQVIVVNGGNFSNPDDFVTVATIDPATAASTEFATIYTQSTTDVVISGQFAYVAALDSIVKLNIDSYEKVAAVYAQGVNQLAIDGDILVATFWYPVTENFVKIFSTEDLSLITEFSEISGDASGIFIKDGVALIAIQGAWGSTTGKIASIDIEEGIVLSEDDYGEFYANIGYFAGHGDQTTAFMKTPWGVTNSKSAIFDDGGEILDEFTYENASLAMPTGKKGNSFYAEINNGIGMFDLPSGELVNAEIIAAQTMTIGASVLDTINDLVYLTTTDFATTGNGFVYNLNGEQTATFIAGISAQAIAVDYRDHTSIAPLKKLGTIVVYPNPTSNFISVKGVNKEVINLSISDISGRVVYSGTQTNRINVSQLEDGVYIVLATTKDYVFSGRFIKN